MEGHFPFTFPEAKLVKVILECYAVGIWFDCKISNGIIRKKAYGGIKANRDVIYIKQEQTWAQYRPLWNTGLSRDIVRGHPLKDNSLSTWLEEAICPSVCFTLDTIVMEFMHQ